MGHTVTALNPAEMALANHHASTPEVARYRGPSRVVHKMNLSRQLTFLHFGTQVHQGL
jgi:hypothetical protein